MSLDQVVAVVLAGGFGTRVRHLLEGIPKPMAAVSGRPFLEWVLRYLAKQGVGRAVLSTGYLADVVESHFKSQPVNGLAAECVRENEPLGTAGGFLNAIGGSAERPEAWLVLNGDSLLFADLSTVARLMSDQRTSGVLLGCAIADASRYGTLAISEVGELLGFAEKRPGKGVINAGIYLLRDALVRTFPKRVPLSFEKDVFPELLESKARLKVSVADAPFLDIGTPESLRQAESFIQANREQFA